MRTVKINIMKMETMEMVSVNDEMPEHWDMEQMWGKGQGSCDCNRETLFNRYCGYDEPGTECSTGRFCVTIEDADGCVLFNDNPNLKFH